MWLKCWQIQVIKIWTGVENPPALVGIYQQHLWSDQTSNQNKNESCKHLSLFNQPPSIVSAGINNHVNTHPDSFCGICFFCACLNHVGVTELNWTVVDTTFFFGLWSIDGQKSLSSNPLVLLTYHVNWPDQKVT